MIHEKNEGKKYRVGPVGAAGPGSQSEKCTRKQPVLGPSARRENALPPAIRGLPPRFGISPREKGVSVIQWVLKRERVEIFYMIHFETHPPLRTDTPFSRGKPRIAGGSGIFLMISGSSASKPPCFQPVSYRNRKGERE